MENWKNILLRTAGFGGGFALVGAVIIGGFVWWSSRPVKPKPWDSNAITASFERITTEGDNNTFVFVYTLQNNTDYDYRVNDKDGIHLAVKLKQANELSFDHTDDLKADYPIYVPARSRVRFILHFNYPYPIKEDLSATDDARSDWYTNLCRYVVKEFTNLDGFELVDETFRFKVDMQNGWADRAKQALKVRAPDKSQ